MSGTKPNRHTELGDFLKALRNRTKPEQLGMEPGSRRRTPGLRREEVAQLAGIGITWYTWLEQGRTINVSESVLGSLSRVFRLTDEERAHLYTLANMPLPQQDDHSADVNDRVLHLFRRMDSLYCPSYIIDQHWNIVVWNQCATTVFGDFKRLPADGRNMIHLMFADQQYMSLFTSWELHAKEMLARFHASFAQHIDDPWFADFIARMKRESEQFSSWWTLYDVNSMTNIVKHVRHPTMGELTFDFLVLDIEDNHNLRMIIYNPDEATARKLRETQ